MGDLPFWLQQLIYQSPALLVYLFGLLLGWAFPDDTRSRPC